MDNVHQFIRFNMAASDSELVSVMRNSLHARPKSERKEWRAQLELSLDGYGGPQSERAGRVRALLPQLDGAPVGDEGDASQVLEAPALDAIEIP
jgi:hypothetical protein